LGEAPKLPKSIPISPPKDLTKSEARLKILIFEKDFELFKKKDLSLKTKKTKTIQS
jgi:hypothetical protein